MLQNIENIKNLENLANIQSPYESEYKRVNEELKKLNQESEKFIKIIFSGIIGKINSKLYEVYIEKDKLISKYSLNEFYSKITINEELYNYFQISGLGSKKQKISFRTIKYLYEKISDQMYAAMEFIKMIEEYQKSNFQVNNLIKKYEIASLGYKDILFSHTEEVFKYIENEKLKELGYRMYDEYKKYREDTKNLYIEIEQLRNNIDEKINSSERPSLEQLKEYRNKLKSEITIFYQPEEETSNNLRR